MKRWGSVSRTFGMLGVVCTVAAASFLFCSGCISSAARPSLISVAQIVDMSRAGLPADEIIARIKASGTVYRLKAGQLTELAEKGVPAAVIDYMQQTYLEAVKRNAAYEGWNNWTMSDDYWYGGVPFGWPYERESVESPQHERAEGRSEESHEHGHR